MQLQGMYGWVTTVGCLTGTTFPDPSTMEVESSRVVPGEYKTISGLDFLT
jgi:hypothetical protein